MIEFIVQNVYLIPLLFSFLLLSHMVVIKRILLNIYFPFNLRIQFNFQESFKNIVMNMKVDTPKGWSTTSSTNGSRCYEILWTLIIFLCFYLFFLNFTFDFLGSCLIFFFSFLFFFRQWRDMWPQSHNTSHDEDIIGLDSDGKN